MPRRAGLSTSNARNLKRMRAAERLRNEEKLTEEPTDRGVEISDAALEGVESGPKRMRTEERLRNEEKLTEERTYRGVEISDAAREGVQPPEPEPGTEKESTALTVASSVVQDKAENRRSRYLQAFDYAGKLVRGDIPMMDEKGQLQRISHANAANYANIRFGLEFDDGTRERLISAATVSAASKASHPPPPRGPVPKKRPISTVLQIQESAMAAASDVDVDVDPTMKKRVRLGDSDAVVALVEVLRTLVAAVEALYPEVANSITKNAHRLLTAHLEARCPPGVEPMPEELMQEEVAALGVALEYEHHEQEFSR